MQQSRIALQNAVATTCGACASSGESLLELEQAWMGRPHKIATDNAVNVTRVMRTRIGRVIRRRVIGSRRKVNKVVSLFVYLYMGTAYV